jgi:hypothetical protein
MIPNTWLPFRMGTHTLALSTDAGSGVLQLDNTRTNHSVPNPVVQALHDGLATCVSGRRLTPQARRAITELCVVARNNDWTPEQLLITVKEACHTSPDFIRLASTSEREILIASVITGTINEFYEPDRGD